MSRWMEWVVSVVLALAANPAAISHASFQEEPGRDSQPSVNVEFILDSSGSMAGYTNAGEIRMDAAKQILHEVIGSIPDAGDRVNVGFRIYGHKGDNTEATKEISCKASEPLVPVDGVDHEALRAAVDSAKPTGWTPISISLGRAAHDFPESRGDTINTVVLVTDGIETCDSDPVRTARKLQRQEGLNLITHVVGFATTPEDQQVLSAIASEGGGQPFGAGNATELRSALFAILEQLKIVVGVGYVGGNAFGLVPEGSTGGLSVVSYAPIIQNVGQVPFVVRNNTGRDLVGATVSLTVRDSAGTLLGAEEAFTLNPFYVRAGGLAFGSIQFAPGTGFPPDASYEFSVGQEGRLSIYADLDIVEAGLFENRIVGTVRNGNESAVDGPLLLQALCFDTAGNVQASNIGTSDVSSLEPNDEQSFQIDLSLTLFSGLSCPAFLVAAQGFGDPRQLPESGEPIDSARDDEEAKEPSQDEATGGEEAQSEEFAIPGLEAAALRVFQSDDSVTTGVFTLNTMVMQFSSEVAANAECPVRRGWDRRTERG